jgi:hypothetical protein
MRPAITRAWSRRYIRRRVAIWSLRERPARRRPPTSGPARSISPRSSAVWTSSSSSRGRKEPEPTSASSWSSAVEHRRQGLRRRAGQPGREHPGVRPASPRCRRPPAASRSGSTSTSAARASAGPPANRPPHRLPAASIPPPTLPPAPSAPSLSAWRSFRPVGHLRSRQWSLPDRASSRATAPAGALAAGDEHDRVIAGDAAEDAREPDRWSIAEARKLAAPGGVRRTTRLAETTAETSSSWQRACRRRLTSMRSGAGGPCDRRPRPARHTQVLADADSSRHRARRGPGKGSPG